MDRGRLEAFSDGVFAVAITLLALNLAVRGPGYGPLARRAGGPVEAFVAYLISFFTIGIIWVNHHALVSNIATVSRLLLFLNLVLLLFVVMVPFATKTVADYLAHGGFDAKVAVAVYGIVLEGMSLGFASMLEWSLRRGAYPSRGAAWPALGGSAAVRLRTGWPTCWSSAAPSSALRPRSASPGWCRVSTYSSGRPLSRPPGRTRRKHSDERRSQARVCSRADRIKGQVH